MAIPLSFQSANAQIHTISDGNASADINVGSPAGMFNWTIAGNDQLNQQWFWFRVGNNPEAPINTISAPLVTTYNGTRGLTTTYANAQFSIRVDYSIAGGLLGGRKSDISEQITINNLSTNSLDIHFFQYSDFNLGGGPGGDSVVIGPPNFFTGKYNVVDQIKPGIAFHEAVITPGADRAEASIVPGTLTKLNDGNPDVLNNFLGPVGPGNVTWAFQWDFSIDPNETEVISKDKYVEVAVVPEPTSAALLLLGGLVLAARRSKRI